MTTPGFDPATLDFYAAGASTYAASRPDSVSPHLATFLDWLPDGGSILELGCGGGTDAEHMIAAGFRVDASDAVPEMAALAEARLGRPVRVMRFDELDADSDYDAVVAIASLLHVPQSELPDILHRIWRALKPGGWHLASYKTGGGEGYDELGRYYNRPSAGEVEAAYRAAGDWAAYRVAESFESGYVGEPSAWIVITAQKPW